MTRIQPQAIPVMEEIAPAKVNLALHVLGRRDDGYHLLDSIVVFAGVHDRLTAEPATGLTLTIGGPFGAALADEADNLVLRAARALAAWAGITPKARLHLDKALPVASGIGGGSADAAAALRLLCRLWRLTPSTAALHRMALALGADVPVCLGRTPARMSGIGEVLAPLPALPALGLLLVNPGVPVATGPVFKALGGRFGPPLPTHAKAAALVSALPALRNDLEAPARALAPAIGHAIETVAALPGCRLARMSGSGSTCFGLFDDAGRAALAAARIARDGWWCWGGGLAAETEVCTEAALTV